jgi:hypothetical protein
VAFAADVEWAIESCSGGGLKQVNRSHRELTPLPVDSLAPFDETETRSQLQQRR